MGTTDVTLERIFQELIAGNAGLAIAEAETYLAAWPNPQTTEKLNVIKAEYQLMEDYWQRGAKDPQRDKQYQLLLRRVYVLCANIAIHRYMASSSYLQMLYSSTRQQGLNWSLSAIFREMESFVSDVAMLELEPEHVRKEKSLAVHQRHHKLMCSLFNYIVTSHIWTDSVGNDIEEILVSPTVDSNDQQLLVSAIMLSLMNRFDMAKFRTLVNTYRRSQDEYVRQRALVGWVLSIDDDFLEVYPEQNDMVAELLKSKRVCQELTELQMQLVYTLNAEKDTTTIQQEIMPDLIKNNSFKVTRNGIEEIPDDPMEDILNPGASEQRMEKLEASFQRMMDMQKQGSDIFFGGFSQMKRFPFFYDICNWFVPFYIQHPDIAQFVQKVESINFLEHALQKGPFCNSDKYSFLIAFQQVMDRLPENLRQMMKRGEASFGEMEDEEQHSPAFIRRSYLMDLYRFFRLFPNRSALCNPFDTSKQKMGMCLFFGSALFHETPLEQHKSEVVAMLMKHQESQAAHVLLDTFSESMRDVQYYLWKGDYERVLELEPDNERALAGSARGAFKKAAYEEAVEAYEKLLLLHPEKTGYMLNKAVCLVKMEEYDDALKLLYQLNYEHPEDLNVSRVLAWTLTCDNKLEQAEKMYQQLIGVEQPSAEDYQNMGYCLWLSGRVEEAAKYFRQYRQAEELSSDTSFLDDEWLRIRGISAIDIKMMESLVKSK